MTSEPAVLRLALRLYPAKYRRERGGEIAAVYADATADGGALAATRELFGIAGYGLRVRTGLTFGGTYGEVAAKAAPLAVGASAGLPLLILVVTVFDLLQYGAESWDFQSRALLGMSVLSLLTVGAVLLGWWPVARGVAALTVVGVPLAAFAELVLNAGGIGGRTVWHLVQMIAPTLLWSLMVLAASPDLLKPRSWRQDGLVVASALVAAVALIGVGLDVLWLPVAVGLPLLVVAGVRGGRPMVAAIGLAGLPLVLGEGLGQLMLLAHGGRNLVVLTAVAVVGGVVLTRLSRPARSVMGVPPTDG